MAHAVQLQISTKEEAFAIKYPGIHNILNNRSTSQLNILSTDTQRVGLRIASRRASAQVKIMVYNAFGLLCTAPNIAAGVNEGEAR